MKLPAPSLAVAATQVAGSLLVVVAGIGAQRGGPVEQPGPVLAPT